VGGWCVTVGVVVTVVNVGEEQGGQTQPPTSAREYMDLRVGPGSPEQVEWSHLLATATLD